MDQKLIERCFRVIISRGLGLDLSDPNLKETPYRLAKMYCSELMSSMNEEFIDFKAFPNKDKYDQIIMLDLIYFCSICAHHFLPFPGKAWLLYIPDKVLVGNSKPARLIEHYSRRPQLQEHLSHQVVQHFEKVIKPLGTMLFMRGVHGCTSCRGVKQYGGSGMATSVITGIFKEDSTLELKGLEMIKISLIDRA